MKAPHFATRCRLSQLTARARQIAEVLLASACAPGPHHPAAAPAPALAQAINTL